MHPKNKVENYLLVHFIYKFDKMTMSHVTVITNSDASKEKPLVRNWRNQHKPQISTDLKPSYLFVALDQSSCSHWKLHPNLSIRHYLDRHKVISVIFFCRFLLNLDPGPLLVFFFFLLGGYEDYIWLSSALPIVLLSHGSQKAFSNYNLARFLWARLTKNTPTLLQWWGKSWRFLVVLLVFLCVSECLCLLGRRVCVWFSASHEV